MDRVNMFIINMLWNNFKKHPTCSVTSCYGINATDQTICSSNEIFNSIDNYSCNNEWKGLTCSICYGINLTNSSKSY